MGRELGHRRHRLRRPHRRRAEPKTNAPGRHPTPGLNLAKDVWVSAQMARRRANCTLRQFLRHYVRRGGKKRLRAVRRPTTPAQLSLSLRLTCVLGSRMRIALVDPLAYTPPAPLTRSPRRWPGRDTPVSLLTSRFPHGPGCGKWTAMTWGGSFVLASFDGAALPPPGRRGGSWR